jgi:hypothetical protein
LSDGRPSRGRRRAALVNCLPLLAASNSFGEALSIRLVIVI